MSDKVCGNCANCGIVSDGDMCPCKCDGKFHKYYDKACRMWKVAVVMLAVVLFCGCKSWHKVVEVPVYIHDTSYVNKEVHDSTYIDKWHTVYINGDTVRMYDSIVMYKYLLKTDTAYKYVEVPVTTTVTETVEVKKPLNWWQKTFVGIGVVSLIALLGIVVWKTRKWWSKII